MASALRTIQLFDTAGLPPRGRHATPLPARFRAKQPADILDFGLNIGAWLADVGDTPARITATPLLPVSGGLAVTALSYASGLVSIWLAGGLPGVDYSVALQIQTFGNRTLDIPLLIYVQTGLPVPVLAGLPFPWILNTTLFMLGIPGASAPQAAPGPVTWEIAPGGFDANQPTDLINLIVF